MRIASRTIREAKMKTCEEKARSVPTPTFLPSAHEREAGKGHAVQQLDDDEAAAPHATLT